MHPDILSGPFLLLLSVVGFAWPLVAGLAIRPVEKIVAGCVLSLLCIGLFAWAVYILALPPTTFWLVPAFSAFAILYRRHAFIATLRDAEVRALLVAQLLVITAIVSGLFSIVSYSGGGWASDWFEHWDRAQFFLNHAPLDHRFLGHYALPARPPLANLVTGAFLALGRVDFAHYQLITALLSSLAFLPAALVAWRFGGRPAIAVLAVLVVVNPLFVQNATFPWTKLPTACFVLTALYFFLRAHDSDAPRVAPALFALGLAGALLTHYSAGPYAVVLATAWLILGWRRRSDPRWWRSTLSAALVGMLVLAPWFVWSLTHFGAAGTFLTNSSIASSAAYPGSQWSKIALNFRDTVIPHFLRPLDASLIAQSSPWGTVRDWFFQSYQLNLPLSFGCVAWIALAVELFRIARAASFRQRALWLASLVALVLLSVAVQGERDTWGLTHICLQSLVLLGLAFLAARWPTLHRRWRAALVAGATVDFTCGIALHFAAQSRVLDHPVPGEFTAYNAAALMNLAAKAQHRLVFLADLTPAPIILMLALFCAVIIVALARARTAAPPSTRPSCQLPSPPSPS